MWYYLNHLLPKLSHPHRRAFSTSMSLKQVWSKREKVTTVCPAVHCSIGKKDRPSLCTQSIKNIVNQLRWTTWWHAGWCSPLWVHCSEIKLSVNKITKTSAITWQRAIGFWMCVCVCYEIVGDIQGDAPVMFLWIFSTVIVLAAEWPCFITAWLPGSKTPSSTLSGSLLLSVSVSSCLRLLLSFFFVCFFSPVSPSFPKMALVKMTMRLSQVVPEEWR